MSLGDLGLQILGSIQERVRFAHFFADLLLQSHLALHGLRFLHRGASLRGFGGLIDSGCGFSQRLVIDGHSGLAHWFANRDGRLLELSCLIPDFVIAEA